MRGVGVRRGEERVGGGRRWGEWGAGGAVAIYLRESVEQARGRRICELKLPPRGRTSERLPKLFISTRKTTASRQGWSGVKKPSVVPR